MSIRSTQPTAKVKGTPTAGNMAVFTSVPGQLEDGGAPGSSGGGTTPIQPDAVSGLKMWLKADAIVGLVDGDAVTTWEDSSSQNNDMTQATAANKPLYKTNIINGLPVVRFDATNDGMTSASALSLSNPFTIFYVANFTAGSGTRRAIQGGGGSNWLLGPYSGTWQWYSGGFAATLGSASSSFVVHGCSQPASGTGYHFLWHGGGGAYYPSLTSGSLSSASRNSPNAIGAVCLGASGSFGESFGGDMAEVIMYNVQVSAADGAGIMAYLVDKYGL